MEEQQPNNEGGGEQRERHEEIQPLIYVASLADWNAGRLHGRWLNAAQAPEQLTEEVQGVLSGSSTANAEEFAIFDYEHFGPLRLSEFETLANVSAIASGIAKRGPAFAHWASLNDDQERGELGGFDDSYAGHFESMADYGEHLVDVFGLRDEIEKATPRLLDGYVHIDVAAFARDLELSGQIMTSEGDGGVYVFERY